MEACDMPIFVVARGRDYLVPGNVSLDEEPGTFAFGREADAREWVTLVCERNGWHPASCRILRYELASVMEGGPP